MFHSHVISTTNFNSILFHKKYISRTEKNIQEERFHEKKTWRKIKFYTYLYTKRELCTATAAYLSYINFPRRNHSPRKLISIFLLRIYLFYPYFISLLPFYFRSKERLDNYANVRVSDSWKPHETRPPFL